MTPNDYLVKLILVKKKILFIISCVLLFFISFGEVNSIADGDPQDIRTGLWLLIPCLVFFIFSLRGHIQSRHAKKYANYFASSHNAFITIEELEQTRRLPASRVLQDLEVLFEKGFFYNCALRRNPNGVLLTNRAYTNINKAPTSPQVDQQPPIAIAVTCHHCGGTTYILSGTRGRCSYCGSEIVGKID